MTQPNPSDQRERSSGPSRGSADTTRILASIARRCGARKSSMVWFSAVMPGQRLSGTLRPTKNLRATIGRLVKRIQSSDGVASISRI